jgi:H+-transporting ATPase
MKAPANTGQTARPRDNDSNRAEGDETRRLGTLPMPELESELGFISDGLTTVEAAARLERFGPNELAEKKRSPVLKLLAHFWGPIPWMIEIAAVFSAIVGHWEDFAIIAVLLAANAAIGFWEEHQADNTIAALRAKLAGTARVKRAGAWTALDARELVPGDLVRLRLGDIVPADVRLRDGDPVEVDQSALTGESLPVTHGPGEAVYSGSIVRQGEIEAVVYGTGARTFFGQTAQLVAQTQTHSHFQKAILQIGNFLIVIALALVLLIVTVALFRGDPLATTLLFALVLTVAAIPVAMPTVLSVTMAVGARLLAAKQAVVSRLASIEELAGVDVLCSDKTGTLTKNSLTAGDVFSLAEGGSDDVVLAAALASREEDRDPIDLAVLAKVADRAALGRYRVARFVPFDPVHKRTEAEVAAPDGAAFRVSKGAPQVILDLAAPDEAARQRVVSAVDAFAERGFRSLGVASTRGGDHWRFLGVIPLFDPPRDDSRSTVDQAREMGIEVKMVTGDQVAIAREVSHQLGLGGDILDAGRFAAAEHHESGQVADSVEGAGGFAQVFPEHKYHIVDVLQQRGHIVGMTGDGVNDAPALKKADVGIAVSGATDAARSAADIVLLNPGLSVVVDAIAESRRIFQRMTSYAIYRIGETIRVLLFMTLSILVFNFYPVTAVMIVLLALLNDGAILTIASDRALGSRHPVRWDMPIVLGTASVLGILGVFASFGLFYLGERVFHFDRAFIQSLMYLKLSVAGHLMIFVTRSRRHFWSERPSTALLAAVIGTQTVATFIAVYGLFMAPIGWLWAAAVWGYALVWFIISDFVKLAAYRAFEHHRVSTPERRRERGTSR